MNSIKNEPDVEIQYIDEEEENNLFKNNENKILICHLKIKRLNS